MSPFFPITFGEKKEVNFQTSHIGKQDLMGPFQHGIFWDAITA